MTDDDQANRDFLTQLRKQLGGDNEALQVPLTKEERERYDEMHDLRALLVDTTNDPGTLHDNWQTPDPDSITNNSNGNEEN